MNPNQNCNYVSIIQQNGMFEKEKYSDYFVNLNNTNIYGFTGASARNRRSEPNYEELRQLHLDKKSLFFDDHFDITQDLPIEESDKQNVIWKRPAEIVDNPQFIVNGANRFDVDQGVLGDCWFLAALANLTMNEKLFSFVVPNDQSLSENYAGIFHFRFWRFGCCYDVVVDDRLPTLDNQLIFLRSSESNEFWSSLIEKAYAKFYGSYKNLIGGWISDALEDLTGGIHERYNTNNQDILKIMQMSFERSSLLGCFLLESEREGIPNDQLKADHAYSITNIRTLNQYNCTLLRIRNPWGNNVEWNGDWSDQSNKWDLVSEATRSQLLVKKADGEFWMQFEDFRKRFQFVDICHLGPSTFFHSEVGRKHWRINIFKGFWCPYATAGGGLHFDTFYHNPQFYFTIEEQNGTESAVLLSLMQAEQRTRGKEYLPLELNLFEVDTPKGMLLEKSFFETNKPIVHKGNSARQLTISMYLPSGHYCIIPSTRKQNQSGEFLLRIFTEVEAHVSQNDEEIRYSPLVHEQVSGTEINCQTLFNRMAVNDEYIDWFGVQRALKKQFETRRIFCFVKPKITFSKNTCKTIISLWDTDFSGRLEFVEFEQLMKDVSFFMEIFKKHDKDNAGKLNCFELPQLFRECGYQVNKKVLSSMILLYSHNGCMSFENFLICVSNLKKRILK